MTDFAELEQLGTSAAATAGAFLLARQMDNPGPLVAGTKSSRADLVTELDTQAEARIRECILQARPGDAILGEEGGQTGSARVRWIVDPLDGTTNYVYGRPDWSVSVAAELDGTVVAGTVYVPRRGAMYTATLGGGAWLVETEYPQELHCSQTADLGEALVSTAFGYGVERRRAQGGVMTALAPRLRGIRCDGSAALDLCCVASGQVDAYYESGLKPWDIAAGALIATEAGAAVSGLNGAPAGPEMTLACSPGLAGPLHDALAALGAGRGQ
jgi:myo-inositol-1(or 4)-monophosphatase